MSSLFQLAGTSFGTVLTVSGVAFDQLTLGADGLYSIGGSSVAKVDAAGARILHTFTDEEGLDFLRSCRDPMESSTERRSSADRSLKERCSG